MRKVLKIRISIYTFSAHNSLFSSVKRLHILCPCMYCHYLPEQSQCPVKRKKANHTIEKMIWQNYIHQAFMMSVSQNSTHASSDLILTRNKDMLDVFLN